jgi:tetratricopeptide (TPR) repeat protein
MHATAFLVTTIGLGVQTCLLAQADDHAPTTDPRGAAGPRLEWQAQDAFYRGRYEDAATLALKLRTHDPESLASYELRTSARLFQLKRVLGAEEGAGRKGGSNKDDALRECAPCTGWLAELREDLRVGQALARSTLKTTPDDITALFFLGKLDLTYLWLELGVLDRRTGWSEFREAKRSLSAVLEHDPEHVRALVAGAWVDYIVGTSLPHGTRWLLGGGSRTRGLQDLRKAAAMDADFFVRTEALFGLWDMEQREANIDEAIAVAHRLARDFPDNEEIAKFLTKHEGRVLPLGPL